MAKVKLNIKAPLIDKEQGTGFRLSTAPAPDPELPEYTGVLSEPMQVIARQYLRVRQKAGEALLDMCRWVCEARQIAKYGEWQIFLEATKTSEDQATALIAVHTQAMTSPIFASAVRSNFLSLSAAYELISAPAQLRDQLLAEQRPIARKQIREEKQAAKSAPARTLDQPSAAENAAPAPDFNDARGRFADIGWRLEKHGSWWKLTKPDGTHYATAEPSAQLRTLATFEAGLAKRALEAVAQPKIPEVDDDPPVGIAQACRVLAEHGYATRLGSDDLWEVRREGKVTSVLTRAQMITHAAALTFLADRRAVLARFDSRAMVSQADYYAALDQIAALLE